MLKNVNSIISSQLAKLVKERKLKDVDILRLCGFTRPTLTKIKNEGNINIETLAALANGLGVKVSFFLDEEVVVEQYHAHGEKGMAVKNIENVDQREMGLPSQRNADLIINDLRNQVNQLQKELLDARAKIITLIEEKK